MAHYDAHGHRNQGLKGYGMKEPAYRAAVVGYSTTSESYVSEQVVKLGGYPYSNSATHDQVWPRSSTRAQPKTGDHTYDYDYSYSPKFSHVNGDSPRKNSDRPSSPPHGHHLGTMHNPHDSPKRNRGNFSRTDDDDDVECRDGVCYPKPKHRQRDYNVKEKNNGNGYGRAGNDQARKESSHHQTSGPRKYYNTEKLPQANNVYGNNHSKPVTDAYYDRFSYPANKVPAPIKTRPDQYPGGSPRKEHHEVIERKEAHRTAPPQSEHKYKGTIDCETLAKMYGGVFVK